MPKEIKIWIDQLQYLSQMIFIKVLCNLGKPKPFPFVSDDGSKWIKLNDHVMYRGLKLNFPLCQVPI